MMNKGINEERLLFFGLDDLTTLASKPDYWDVRFIPGRSLGSLGTGLLDSPEMLHQDMIELIKEEERENRPLFGLSKDEERAIEDKALSRLNIQTKRYYRDVKGEIIHYDDNRSGRDGFAAKIAECVTEDTKDRLTAKDPNTVFEFGRIISFSYTNRYGCSHTVKLSTRLNNEDLLHATSNHPNKASIKVVREWKAFNVKEVFESNEYEVFGNGISSSIYCYNEFEMILAQLHRMPIRFGFLPYNQYKENDEGGYFTYLHPSFFTDDSPFNKEEIHRLSSILKLMELTFLKGYCDENRTRFHPPRTVLTIVGQVGGKVEVEWQRLTNDETKSISFKVSGVDELIDKLITNVTTAYILFKNNFTTKNTIYKEGEFNLTYSDESTHSSESINLLTYLRHDLTGAMNCYISEDLMTLNRVRISLDIPDVYSMYYHPIYVDDNRITKDLSFDLTDCCPAIRLLLQGSPDKDKVGVFVKHFKGMRQNIEALSRDVIDKVYTSLHLDDLSDYFSKEVMKRYKGLFQLAVEDKLLTAGRDDLVDRLHYQDKTIMVVLDDLDVLIVSVASPRKKDKPNEKSTLKANPRFNLALHVLGEFNSDITNISIEEVIDRVYEALIVIDSSVK